MKNRLIIKSKDLGTSILIRKNYIFDFVKSISKKNEKVFCFIDTKVKNIIKLNKCKINWCLIEINNYKGWVIKKNIWGVREKEIFKINFYQKIEDFYWWSINTLGR